jgi:hypothetical protein
MILWWVFSLFGGEGLHVKTILENEDGTGYFFSAKRLRPSTIINPTHFRSAVADATVLVPLQRAAYFGVCL